MFFPCFKSFNLRTEDSIRLIALLKRLASRSVSWCGVSLLWSLHLCMMKIPLGPLLEYRNDFQHTIALGRSRICSFLCTTVYYHWFWLALSIGNMVLDPRSMYVFHSRCKHCGDCKRLPHLRRPVSFVRFTPWYTPIPDINIVTRRLQSLCQRSTELGCAFSSSGILVLNFEPVAHDCYLCY
jgi:hypothetical protein